MLFSDAEVRAAIEACGPNQVLLGRGADGLFRYWDTSHEDPHIAMHGGSRRGKTRVLLLIAAQEIRKGAELVTAIDPKRIGLMPLARFGPAVDLHNDPRDIDGQWNGGAPVPGAGRGPL